MNASTSTITFSVTVSVAELSKHTEVSQDWIRKNAALLNDYFQGYFLLSVKNGDYDGEISENAGQDRLLTQAVDVCEDRTDKKIKKIKKVSVTKE